MKRQSLFVMLLFSVAVNAPFVNQAFHMDDGVFLLSARQVFQNPLFPQDVPLYFEGVLVKDLASAEHPPLTAYFMALCAAVGGRFSEVVLHTGFLLFPAILAAGMYSLACRFTSRPLIATLLVLVTPVVYVMSHTLMADLPFLALWTASVALFVHGVDSGRTRWTTGGTVLAALTSLVSYAGLSLVPLLALYAVLRKSRSGLAMVILPVSLFGLWVGLSSFHFGRFTPGALVSHYFYTEKVLSPSLLMNKLVFAVVFLGGITIFPPALLAVSTLWRIAAGIGLGAAIARMTAVNDYSLVQKGLFVLLFAAGFAAVWEILVRLYGSVRRIGAAAAGNGADDLFLGLWFLGATTFCVTFYLTGAARYLLPAIPPLVLMMVRRAERVMPGNVSFLAVPALVLTGLMALALAIADYQFADVYRSFAASVPGPRWVQKKNVWFTGEWGFRAYLEAAGGRELGRRDSRPAPGDCLVVPTLATPYTTLFSDRLGLDSIVLVAPCRAVFDVPAVSPAHNLIVKVGMPLWDKSDGLDFRVDFVSPADRQPLRQARLDPGNGHLWSTWKLPLAGFAGRQGRIVFSAEPGGSGNADADWVAIARARICEDEGVADEALYDFQQHLAEARIEAAPGVQYQTPGNRPVFPLPVWLDQPPTKVLLRRQDYIPALPIRLLDRNAHAGFWSMGWGMLPYSFVKGDSVLESISVYEVTREVEAYHETNPSWPPGEE